MSSDGQPNAVLPPIDVGCECETPAVGQDGWRDLSPFHREVLAFYPEHRRSAIDMLALWQATMILWDKKIAPAWQAKVDALHGKGWPAELRRIQGEMEEWKRRMAGYQVALQANTRATSAAIKPSVTQGLLLDSPTAIHAVPDFLFPLYLDNQINVLEAAHKENRKYFRLQLVEQARKIRDALLEVPAAAARVLFGDLLLPILVSVAGGVAVYLITTRRTTR